MSETVYASWTIDKTQHRFWIALVTTIVAALFLTSLWLVYVLTKTDNIFLAVVPILLFLALLALLPEALIAWGSLSQSGQVYLTERGAYLRFSNNANDYKFIAWENTSQYDSKSFNSVSFIGKIFPKPTRFFLKGRYEEDSLAIEAFGDDSDTLRAYLKEKNVLFGFAKK